MAYSIRPAEASDEPSLQVVRQQAMEASFSGHYPPSAYAGRIATPDEQLATWIEDSPTVVLVAETEVTVIAYGACNAASGRVLALYTAPDYQNQGCATAVLDRLERRVRGAGGRRLQATVPEPAVGFFLARGFERGRTTDGDGLAMVAVEKPLT